MHGDFIHRNLPAAFIKQWDEWFQLYISSSKEQMGEDWLNTYLTSPIWRFVLSAGVIDEKHWAGIMLPSVDHVGRYFPFSVVMPLEPDLNPLEFISLYSHWFERIEALALQALEELFTVDELVEKINEIPLDFTLSYRKTGQKFDGAAQHLNMNFDESMPTSIYACFLDLMLADSLGSYSVWTTQGSEKVNPCSINCKNLPPANRLPAMLDGDWAHWGWPQTYSAK